MRAASWLRPLLWLAAGALGSRLTHGAAAGAREILSAWLVVVLNAGLAAWIPRWIRTPDPTLRTLRNLSGQMMRAGLIALAIFFPIRLDFLNFAAFVSAALTGYLTWLAGHVWSLHRNSLPGIETDGSRHSSSGERRG
jgi:hypothetical protein